MVFLLVTTRADELAAFTRGLTGSGEVELAMAVDPGQALDVARDKAPVLAVVDKDLPGSSSLGLVGELLKVNAMINTAVVSDMSEEDFHEESEGLGVLAQVPPNPGEQDGKDLADKLRGLLQY